MRGKKGFFMPLLAIFEILILTSIFIVLVVKLYKINENFSAIGQKQFELIENVVNNAEKALLYVDQASLYSLRQAAYKLGQQGGYGENGGCGINKGYTLWNKKGAECYPNGDKVEENLKVELQNEQNKYFARYPEIIIPQTNYEIALRGKLEVVGRAKEPIKLGTEIAVKETVPEPEPEKPGEAPGTAPEPVSGRGGIVNPLEWMSVSVCWKGYTNEGYVHSGLDLRNKRGVPVFAVADGKVIATDTLTDIDGKLTAYGKTVILEHFVPPEIIEPHILFYSRYGHLDRFAVNLIPGKIVKAGEVIGYVDTTGRSTGDHLHLEFYFDNPYTIKYEAGTNPYCYLPNRDSFEYAPADSSVYGWSAEHCSIECDAPIIQKILDWYAKDTEAPAPSELACPFDKNDKAIALAAAFHNEYYYGPPIGPEGSGDPYAAGSWHTGIDYYKKSGSGFESFPLYAVADGIAYFRESNGDKNKAFFSGTKFVDLDIGNGIVIRYLHVKDFAGRSSEVNGKGIRVRAGEQIANVGDTGTGGELHLHLGVLTYDTVWKENQNVRESCYDNSAYSTTDTFEGDTVTRKPKRQNCPQEINPEKIVQKLCGSVACFQGTAQAPAGKEPPKHVGSTWCTCDDKDEYCSIPQGVEQVFEISG